MSQKVIVVMPAYNAGKTLAKTYLEISKEYVDEVLLVDDNSKDNTVEIAHSLGIKTIVHPKNLGYGGNQKTCYNNALRMGANIAVMLHPDYQYDCKVLPLLINPIKGGFVDIMLGSRVRSRKEVLKNGMPLYKYLGNRLLTLLENLVLNQHLSEYHTGFRAFRREALEFLPYKNNSNGFVFDQEILIQAKYYGFKIGEIFSPAKYFREASSIGFIKSVEYGIKTLSTLLKYLLQRWSMGSSKIFKEAE